MNLEVLLKTQQYECTKQPGLYLTMTHGRTDPEQQMDDWGTEGPSIGPLKWCHITYNASINLAFASGEITEPMLQRDPLHFHDDMLYYDGVYYGDWSLELLEGESECATT